MKTQVKKKINLSSENTMIVNLDLGFTYTKIDNVERPKCVVYLKVLAADSTIPNKLERHFESNRDTLINKKNGIVL